MAATCDYAIVGGGIFGSSAAYHLAELLKKQSSEAKVVLIAPDEPPNHDEHDGVFGSHYDEGRITRELDADLVWSMLASSSIDRYRELETVTGCDFYSELGYVCLGHDGNEYTKRVEEVAEERSIDYAILTLQQLKDRYPSMHAPTACNRNLLQSRRSGCLSPRKYVHAATTRAVQLGVNLIRTQAVGVRWSASDDSAEIRLANGTVLQAKSAIIATGAFTDDSLTDQQHVPLKVQGRTVLLTEVNESEPLSFPSFIAEDVAGLPHDLYGLPPLRYPNGKLYVKLGTGDCQNPLEDLSSKLSWFQGPPGEDEICLLKQAMQTLFPQLEGRPCTTANCALTFTTTGYPYLDFLRNTRLLIATGGNGGGAKSGNEIGRLASLRLLGQWDDKYDINKFKLPESTPAN